MKKLIAAAFAVALASGAFADTVAWWHFDEMDAGTLAPANTITNETAPGVYARAFSYEGSAATENSGAYLPTYAKPFAGLKVVDPVSGASRVNRSAMEFKSARGGADPSGNSGKAYYGGALAVPGGYDLYSPLYGTHAMTVECFVCTTGCVSHTASPLIAAVDVANPDNPSAVSDNFATKQRFAICYETHEYDDGGVCIYFRTNGVFANHFIWNKTKKINDGLWHHVALTYDGSRLRLYTDYVLQVSIEASGDIENYASGTMTWIGGYGAYTGSSGQRRFNGFIDEVRVSNVALAPGQFLRLEPVAPPSDPDEVLRLRFNSASNRAQLQYSESMSENFGTQAVYRAVSGSAPSEFDRSDRVGAMMFDSSIKFNDGVTNTAALHSFTNGASMANYIEVPDFSGVLGLDGADYGNPSWTVEAFYKSPAIAKDQTLFKMGVDWETVAHVYFRRDNDHSIVGYPQFCFSTNNASMTFGKWEGVNADKRPADGKWHHIAMVSDAAANSLRCYCDYKLSASFDMQPGTGLMVTNGLSFFVGSAVDGSGQFFDGWIDDVRVTKRALQPKDFLTTHSVQLAKFEKNYLVDSLNDTPPPVTGAGYAYDGGAAPVFVRTTPGLLRLDGTNGTQLAANFHSVYLDGSRVSLGTCPLYENESFTVEFFSKFTGFSGGYAADSTSLPKAAGILRRIQAGDWPSWDWHLYRRKDAADGIGLGLRSAADRSDTRTRSWNIPNNVVDGKWHHYALTFGWSGTQTDVSLYYDYKLVGTQNVPFRIYAHPDGDHLAIGESRLSYSDPAPFVKIQGYVNSLRFSRGVLPPEKFLGLAPAVGMLSVFR